MSIQVRFFASLREKLGTETATVSEQAGLTVQEVWQSATGDADYPANTLCAINMEYSRLTTEVKNGDEVAFFPPVTGG